MFNSRYSVNRVSPGNRLRRPSMPARFVTRPSESLAPGLLLPAADQAAVSASLGQDAEEAGGGAGGDGAVFAARPAPG